MVILAVQDQDHDVELPVGGDPVRSELLAAMVESAPVAMLIVDENGRIVFANQEAQTLFGYALKELLGEPIEPLIPESARSNHIETRSAFFAAPSARPMGAGRNLHGLHKNGSLISVEIALKPLATIHGRFVLAVVVDISERRRLEQRFEVAVEAAPIAMFMVDQRGQILLVNREAEKLYGYTRAELIGRAVDLLVPEALRTRDPDTRERFFATPIVRRMGVGNEFRGLRKDGTELPLEIGLNPIQMDDSQFVIITVVDISERKQLEAEVQRAAEELEYRVEERTAELARANREKESLLASLETQRLELERLSREDPLTRLANRRDFDARLDDEIQRAQRFGMPLATAMFDLDHFKRINDRFGHAAGDAVLREIAALMRQECRAVDIIARYGGEEFALALPGSNLRAGVILCERVRGAIERFNWSHLIPGLSVTISAGVSEWTAESDAASLLAGADANLYAAKRDGRNRVMPAPNDLPTL